MTPQNNTPWWDTDRPKQDDTPWWDRSDDQEEWQEPVQEAAPKQIPHPTIRHRIIQWVNQNVHTVIYMTIGLLLAVGILNIGFWRTFLVALCLATGYILGSWHDGNPKLIRRIKRFSQRFIDDNPFMK